MVLRISLGGLHALGRKESASLRKRHREKKVLEAMYAKQPWVRNVIVS